MTATFYQILEIQRTASTDEVKKAFRTLAKKHHPDVGGSEEKFKKISQAYATLSDPVKRRSYDLTIPSAPRPASMPSDVRENMHKQAMDDFMEQFSASSEAVNRAIDEMIKNMQQSPLTATKAMHNVTYTRGQTVRPQEIYFDPISGHYRTRPKP